MSNYTPDRPNPSTAELGAAYLAVEFLVGLGYVGVGAAIGAISMTTRAHRWIDLGSGVCFLALAGLLAVDEAGRA